MLRELLVIFYLGGVLTIPPPPNSLSNDEWWRDTFIYQVYPRSFKDSDGDGVGDLNGVTEKLDHLVDMNVSGLWLSPIFTSPMVDFGYDISNFTDIDKTFGTIEDFTKLTSAAHSRGLKIILDFVPNHSSNEHPWFAKSIKKIKPYDNYYVWKDAKIINGTRQPPNNWLSIFFGSAWEWNEERQQYYLHQFAIKQPDLNFNSPELRKEMENAILFWADRGIDGFRIDSMPYMYEDSQFRDEPVIPNNRLQSDDPATLDHIYTKDQQATYDLLKTWRNVLDSRGGEKQIILVEAYATLPLTVKYFNYGANIPFNFMFVTGLNNHSSALDFKRSIDQWTNNIPSGNFVSNWVVDNHDNPRTSARFGVQRSDQISMLCAILPGVGIIYNGDEIGMKNGPVLWNQTVDTQGLSAGPNRYMQFSRDPERTPFQWDNTTSAGFSSNIKTWLPVNPNYKNDNLAEQKKSLTSHYSIFKKLVALKSSPIIKTGTSEVILAGKDILGVVRRQPNKTPVILLINFSDKSITVDASAWLNIPDIMNVYVASVGSNITFNSRLDTTALQLPGAASLILN